MGPLSRYDFGLDTEAVMRSVVIFCLSILFSQLACAAAPQKSVDLTMSWRVSLDAKGAITSLEPADASNPGLYQRLGPEIRKWHFATGKVRGVPAPAETTLTVQITLQPVDGFYRVLLRSAGTGARYATVTTPKYPDGAMMSKRGGAVLLEVHYDAKGNVTEVSLLEGGLPKPGSDIERSAIAAVKHWTFTPESIAGHGIAGVVRVPVCFSARPGAENTCRWKVGGSDVPLDTKMPIAMNSVVHLETEIAGLSL